MNKICGKCKDEKDIELFSFKNKEKVIKSSICKSCHKGMNRQAHLKRRDEIRDNRNTRKTEIKIWFNDYKKNLKCNQCPENHISCLDFHHINDDKYRSVSELVAFGWGIEKIKEEIAKCIVLCSNCHRKLHWKLRNT